MTDEFYAKLAFEPFTVEYDDNHGLRTRSDATYEKVRPGAVLRLKPVEVALLLQRIGDAYPEEVLRLRNHLEVVGSEDQLLTYVREMIGAIERSTAADNNTSEAVKSVNEAVKSNNIILDRFVTAQEETNKLEDRRLTTHQNDLDRKYRDIWKPIVGALVGILATLMAMMSQQCAHQPWTGSSVEKAFSEEASAP